MNDLNHLAWDIVMAPPIDKPEWVSHAVSWAKRATELDPEEGIYWNTLGGAQCRSGEYEAAIESLERSIELGESDACDLLFQAMASWWLGDQEMSRDRFDQAVTWIEENAPEDEDLQQIHQEARELLESQT